MKKITNYNRIKSMSVEEMAEWIVGIKLKFGIESHKHDANVIISKLNEEEKQELNGWWDDEKKTYTQWLLQDVSDENITKIEHNSLCETKTYKKQIVRDN